MTEKKRYKFKKENVNDFDEYGLESPILLEEDVLTFGEVIDKLNGQEERIRELERDNFNFNYTENYDELNANTLEVNDKHTKIRMNGKTIKIILIPPKSEPYSFKYYITGIRFVEQIGDVND